MDMKPGRNKVKRNDSAALGQGPAQKEKEAAEDD